MTCRTTKTPRRCCQHPGAGRTKQVFAMGYLIALFAFLARLFRPSQGVHASPYGYARELYAETTRSPRRTRVVHAEGEPFPRIPAPRKPVDDELPRTLCPVPADYVPIVNPCAIPPADCHGPACVSTLGTRAGVGTYRS